MDEYFLQFLWKFQKFPTQQLTLVSGERLTVFQPGYQNEDAGPDFSEAKLKIGDIVWSGSVEIHYRSSDWYHHKHHQDQRYENVILHVVWSDDKEIAGPDGKPLPTLEMAKYAPKDLEREYRKYINQPEVILCSDRLPEIPSIQISMMLDKAFAGRLQEKAEKVLEIVKTCNDDWEETAYRILARNFGFKTNSEPFEKLAATLPCKVLQKHLDHPQQVEALIFGQAGFLENVVDSYGTQLVTEYEFLKKKYRLDQQLSRHHWKFSRLRPANFPTVRLAQFAAMITATKGIFAKLTTIATTKEAEKFIKQPLPVYWKTHYDFGKQSGKVHAIGSSSVENIIINSVVPLLGAYAKHTDDPRLLEKAEALLDQLNGEQNKYIKKWIAAGIAPKNAKDSQALLYQYQSYCQQKKCLRCNIGLSIISA